MSSTSTWRVHDFPTGGRIDEGDTPENCAVRELREEGGETKRAEIEEKLSAPEEQTFTHSPQ